MLFFLYGLSKPSFASSRTPGTAAYVEPATSSLAQQGGRVSLQSQRGDAAHDLPGSVLCLNEGSGCFGKVCCSQDIRYQDWHEESLSSLTVLFEVASARPRQREDLLAQQLHNLPHAQQPYNSCQLA